MLRQPALLRSLVDSENETHDGVFFLCLKLGTKKKQLTYLSTTFK